MKYKKVYTLELDGCITFMSDKCSGISPLSRDEQKPGDFCRSTSTTVWRRWLELGMLLKDTRLERVH